MDNPEDAQHPRLPAPKTWDEYYEGATGWLSEHWRDAPECQSCKNPDHLWTVGEALGLFSSPGWPTFRSPGVTPMVPVSCSHCGHTMLFNALRIFHPQQPNPQIP